MTIVILSIILAGLGQYTEEWLRYDRFKILEGEIWRLLSAHFLHLTWNHLFMNLGGLLFIFFFFGKLLGVFEWLFVILSSSFAISLTLLITNPDLVWYVGLSGVLHALFIVGGLADIKVRPKEAYLFLSFIITKLLYEQFFGALPGSEEAAGGPVLVDAHFYGAIWGGLGYLLIVFRLKNKTQI